MEIKKNTFCLCELTSNQWHFHDCNYNLAQDCSNSNALAMLTRIYHNPELSHSTIYMYLECLTN